MRIKITYENFLEATDLLNQAGKARENGDWERAKELETKAAAIDPDLYAANFPVTEQ